MRSAETCTADFGADFAFIVALSAHLRDEGEIIRDQFTSYIYKIGIKFQFNPSGFRTSGTCKETGCVLCYTG